MEKVLHTKWGKANINNYGYYRITSRKEGNFNKQLHRLIWEDFYNTEVPKGYVIHHKNGNKLDNCILNLQLMRDKDHTILHHTGNKYWDGKKHSDESKNKISISVSKRKTTTGYFRVTKHKNKKYKQGFTWYYQYYEEGKRKSICSVSLKKLEAKVRAKGLKWEKLKGGD